MDVKFQPGLLDSKTFAERAAGFTAFIIPFILGILSASPEAYWLDSPELTAAVLTIGTPHPPGHPLYVMLAKVFTLLPLGNIAFRVSLASSFFGAAATCLLFKICFRLVSIAVRTLPLEAAAILSLASALIAFVSHAWWFQCVRQEVYSLQILLTLGAAYPALIFCLEENERKERWLILSAFITGLGFANHHFIAAAALPAFIPMVVFLSRSKGGLGATAVAFKMAATGVFGLLPYMLLPLRRSTGAAVALGGVHSWSDLWFVMSAKAYQKSMIAHYAAGFGKLPSAFLELREFGLFVLVAALLGVVLLFRAQRTRQAGVFIALSALIPLILRQVLKLDPFEPDYQGYMLPIFAASAIGFSIFAAVTLSALLSQLHLADRFYSIAASLLLVVPLTRAMETQSGVNLSSFRATRQMTDFCFGTAAQGTLVLPSDYNLFFALSSARFVDGTRPDLVVVNPLLLSYPGYLHATLTARPSLAPLARSMLVYGELTESALVEAALAQPLLVEAAPNLDDETIQFLLPEGPLYRAQPQPLAESDVSFASIENRARWKRFMKRIGTGAAEPETRRMLFSIHYRDALFTVRRGDIQGARVALDEAFHLEPFGDKILRFKKALSEIKVEDEDDPIDIKPFLP
jgi:hypothetical protein